MLREIGDDRVIEQYYAELRESVFLSVSEERKLVQRYMVCGACRWKFPPSYHEEAAPPKVCRKCGEPRDFKAHALLIKGALRFVVKVAREYALRARGRSHSSAVLKNLISAGNVGLLIAIERYDLKKKTRLLTYAAWWIRERIREELDRDGVVRVPSYKQKDLRARRRRGEVIVEPAPVVMVDTSHCVAAETHADLPFDSEREILNRYGVEIVHQAITKLGLRARDQYIVMLYYGIREEPKNLRQIAARLGELTPERVRQIKEISLGQLRDYLAHSAIESAETLFST